MKKKLLQKLIAACIVAAPMSAFAQADIHFSQFYETSILRNPALTGVFPEDAKFGVTYRNQWSSISNPFQTAVVSAEGRLSISSTSNDFFSFGVLGYYDKAGSIDQKIVAAYPAVNYNKSLTDDHASFLSVGFTGGYVQYSFDPSKATFNNQYQGGVYNPANPTGENLPSPKIAIWDLGAGVNYNTSNERNTTTFIMGVAGYHLTQPKDTYYQDPNIRMNMRWNVNAALSQLVAEDVTVQFQANAALQGTYHEIIGGALIGWNALTQADAPLFAIYAGVFYRVQDALIPMLKVRYKDMTLGVSYDVNNSSLKEASNMQGGYEITLYKTAVFKRDQGLAKTICPRF